LIIENLKLKMSNKNLVRYKLAPQTKFYDSMLADWKPFIMFSQFPNVRSKYCNTDIFGLRFNNLEAKKNDISIFDENIPNNKKKAVLVGNSLAFGEGSTSDQNTISNHLNKLTNYHFFNFSGRGFSGYQEITNFLLQAKRIKNLERIIIVSGVIDSFLPYFIKDYDDNLVPIFGYNSFLKTMQSNTGWKNKIFKFFFSKFFSSKLNWSRINSLNWCEELFKKRENVGNIERNNPDNNLKHITDRNLMIWSTISKGMNIKIDFVFQPVGSWCKKKMSSEEKELFNEEDKSDLKKIYKHVDEKKYILFKDILIKSTKKYDISFLDLNSIFSDKKFDEKWIFLSRFHATDLGCKYIAEELVKNLSLE